MRAALARLAGTEVTVIKLDLRLEELVCDKDAWRDLIQVLEHELGLRAYPKLEDSGKKKELPPPVETVWDLVKVFHKAECAWQVMQR